MKNNCFIILLVILFSYNNTSFALDSDLFENDANNPSLLKQLSDCPVGKFGEICDEYIYSSDSYDIKTEDETKEYLNGDWEIDLSAFSSNYYKDSKQKVSDASFVLSIKNDVIDLKTSESNEVESCDAGSYKVSYKSNDRSKGTVYANATIVPRDCHWRFLVKDKNRLVLIAYDFFLPMRRMK